MDQMETGIRESICEVVEGVSLELTRSLRKKKKKTVLNALLDDVINGYKILSKCLDDLITRTTDNPDSETFALRINFEGLIETSSTKQCGHLIEIFNKSKSGTEKDFPIIRHPVIALFIWKKWRMAIWFFLINAVLYIIFLSIYTWMILWIFSNDKGNGNVEGNPDSVGFIVYRSPITDSGFKPGRTCRSAYYDFGYSRMPMIISVTLLSLWEIMQMIRLGRRYFKEIENYIEIFVFSTAILLIQDVQSCLDNDFRRGIIAFGISLGWVELVFLTGRLGLITK